MALAQTGPASLQRAACLDNVRCGNRAHGSAIRDGAARYEPSEEAAAVCVTGTGRIDDTRRNGGDVVEGAGAAFADQ